MIDLNVLFAEVEAEHKAAKKKADAEESKAIASIKAEKRAYVRMVRAAHNRGEY